MPGRLSHPTRCFSAANPRPCAMPRSLICWGRGQQSRVHNHANSHCWLNVLSGEVEELRYSTGTTPVHVEPAVAPRLPGVISATT